MPKRLTKKTQLVILGGLIIIAAMVAFFNLFHKPKAKTLVQPKTEQNPGNPVPPSTTGQGSGNKTNGTEQSPAPAAPAPAANLPAPKGTVVSNHNVKMSDPLESACQTLATANCIIKITGIKTVSLQPTNQDDNGQFLFDWSAKSAGLSPGDWNVQLVATLGSQTATSDTQILHVSP